MTTEKKPRTPRGARIPKGFVSIHDYRGPLETATFGLGNGQIITVRVPSYVQPKRKGES